MNILSYIYNVFFVNVNLIYPRLWLGNRHIALDKNFILENDINLIVNCTKEIPFVTEKEVIDITDSESQQVCPLTEKLFKIEMIRIPVDDSLLERDFIAMEHYMQSYLPKIIAAYKSNKNILVHCYAGKQRSAIIVASLLYSLFLKNKPQEQWTKEDKEELTERIFAMILAERPQAFTFGYRINFLKTFRRFFKLDD